MAFHVDEVREMRFPDEEIEPTPGPGHYYPILNNKKEMFSLNKVPFGSKIPRKIFDQSETIFQQTSKYQAELERDQQEIDERAQGGKKTLELEKKSMAKTALSKILRETKLKKPKKVDKKFKQMYGRRESKSPAPGQYYRDPIIGELIKIKVKQQLSKNFKIEKKLKKRQEKAHSVSYQGPSIHDKNTQYFDYSSQSTTDEMNMTFTCPKSLPKNRSKTFHKNGSIWSKMKSKRMEYLKNNNLEHTHLGPGYYNPSYEKQPNFKKMIPSSSFSSETPKNRLSFGTSRSMVEDPTDLNYIANLEPGPGAYQDNENLSSFKKAKENRKIEIFRLGETRFKSKRDDRHTSYNAGPGAYSVRQHPEPRSYNKAKRKAPFNINELRKPRDYHKIISDSDAFSLRKLRLENDRKIELAKDRKTKLLRQKQKEIRKMLDYHDRAFDFVKKELEIEKQKAPGPGQYHKEMVVSTHKIKNSAFKSKQSRTLFKKEIQDAKEKPGVGAYEMTKNDIKSRIEDLKLISNDERNGPFLNTGPRFDQETEEAPLRRLEFLKNEITQEENMSDLIAEFYRGRVQYAGMKSVGECY